jgi:hypothetical protein
MRARAASRCIQSTVTLFLMLATSTCAITRHGCSFWKNAKTCCRGALIPLQTSPVAIDFYQECATPGLQSSSGHRSHQATAEGIVGGDGDFHRLSRSATFLEKSGHALEPWTKVR